MREKLIVMSEAGRAALAEGDSVSLDDKWLEDEKTVGG